MKLIAPFRLLFAFLVALLALACDGGSAGRSLNLLPAENAKSDEAERVRKLQMITVIAPDGPRTLSPEDFNALLTDTCKDATICPDVVDPNSTPVPNLPANPGCVIA